MKQQYNAELLSKIRTFGLILLTLALTSLSVKAQFNFWKVLFGIETAVTASFVFELLRILSLFNVIRRVRGKKVIGMMIYLPLAMFCGIIAIISWHSEIIEINMKETELNNIQYQKKIELIKTEYAQKVNENIYRIDKDIYYVDSRIAGNSNSVYWVNRKLQLENSKIELINEMDLFLSQEPENPQIWIEKNSAILNLEVDPSIQKSNSYNSLEISILNIFHLTPEKARKLVAIVFVIFVEIGILFLAFMTENDKSDNGMTIYQKAIIPLESMHNPDDIKFLLLKCSETIRTRGLLSKSSEVTAKLRPIRKDILKMNLNKQQMYELFNHYFGT